MHLSADMVFWSRIARCKSHVDTMSFCSKGHLLMQLECRKRLPIRVTALQALCDHFKKPWLVMGLKAIRNFGGTLGRTCVGVNCGDT